HGVHLAQMPCLPHPLPPDLAATLADRFRLLAEPTRLRLLDMLRDGERTVGSLAEELGCTQANASKQLGLLADAGVLVRRKQGLHCYYGIADHGVFALCDSVCELLMSEADAR